MLRTGRVLAVIFLAQLVRGQILLVDRQPPAATLPPLRLSQPGAFLGDHFRIGSVGENWVVDTIRTWVEADGQPAALALYGGIETADAAAPAAFECDCHNLVALNSAPEIAAAGTGRWQAAFQRLQWSVPGGVEIQFGIKGAASSVAVATAADHELRVFEGNGKLKSPFDAGSGRSLGIAIQVWGHRMAVIRMLAVGSDFEVTLEGSRAFDTAKADPAAFRFGPAGARPVSDAARGTDRILRFRRADAGFGSNDISACMDGQFQDGTPFAGCDLLKKHP